MGTEGRYRKWVLVVEDDELDAYLLVNLLQECDNNITVEVASTAVEGLGKIRKRHYDLVVSDYRLPGMNGLSFLKRAKKIGGAMRGILLTGYPGKELEAQVIHHGVCTYLSKAAGAQTLLRVMREALSLHEPAISI
jgi:CheY-like chemotaxis protein